MMGEEQRPVVSVLCMCYNHVQFIATALQSFVDQRLDGAMEVVVHDDASTDGSVDVIRDFEARYPHLIRGIYQTENQHRIERGRVTRILYGAARGKYIALCEGDDHWIDPLKLQKQVDALEANPEAVGCYTNAYNESEGIREPYHGGLYGIPDSASLDEERYITGSAIPTCTFMFRRENLKTDMAVLIKQFATGDTALFLHLLGQGNFIYLPIYSGVRVRHAGGMYSMQGSLHHLRVALHNLTVQDRLTQGRYGHLIRKRRLGWLKRSWQEAMHHRNWELGREAWSHLRKERAEMGWSLPRTWVNGLLVHYPNLVFRLVAMKQGLRRVWGGAPRT